MAINGHVYPQVDQHDWGRQFAQRPLLYRNLQEASSRWYLR